MSRKSDVALPTIMNVFLMIAVILVASSFLLKAFGIDIWGFLGNLFAGLSTSKPGKVLHVKIDSAKNEVWEFHLTDEKKHCQEFYSSPTCGQIQSSFYIDSSNWKKKECILFTTIQRDEQCVLAPPFGALRADAGNIYYVNPGSIIQNDKDCGKNLGSCLINPTSGCNFKDLKSSPGQYTIIGDRSSFTNLIPVLGTPCASDEDKNKILNYLYNSNAEFSDDSSGGCSIKKSLLEEGQYTVKEGLICDGNGIWQPCTEQRAKDIYGVDVTGFKYICQQDGTWKTKMKPTKIDCAYPYPENCIFNKESINLGEQVQVGGFLKTEDDNPIKGKTLKLFLIKEYIGEEYKTEYVLVKDASGNPVELTTDENGYAANYWTPQSSYVGDGKYYLSFDGDNLYKMSTISIYYSLKIIPPPTPTSSNEDYYTFGCYNDIDDDNDGYENGYDLDCQKYTILTKRQNLMLWSTEWIQYGSNRDYSVWFECSGTYTWVSSIKIDYRLEQGDYFYIYDKDGKQIWKDSGSGVRTIQSELESTKTNKIKVRFTSDGTSLGRDNFGFKVSEIWCST